MIVDYGAGNLRSLQNALDEVGVSHELARTPDQISRANKLLLPGVGSFVGAMEILKDRALADPIVSFARSGKPLLGICLGMQLLCTDSTEHGLHEGLGVIPLRVDRLPTNKGIRVPHVGWNTLVPVDEDPLLADVPEDSDVYFVHSYAVTPTEDTYLLAVSDHGVRFGAMIRRGYVYGAQFHPEKSQHAGLQILRNFASL